jgi:hypothetical protein
LCQCLKRGVSEHIGAGGLSFLWRLTSNSGDGALLGLSLSNGVAISSELPEALGVIDVSVGEFTGELLLVNVAEVVRARGVILQGHSEQGSVQLRFDSVEESSLRLRPDCSYCKYSSTTQRAMLGRFTSVDRAESQTQQTVVVLILSKLLADFAGSLNSLTLGSDTAHGDGVLIDVTASAAAITIGDVPAGALDLGGVAGRLVDVVPGLLGLGELIGEDPAESSLVKLIQAAG